MKAKIRILLADDHESVREGLSALLRDMSGFELVGHVKDGSEAIVAARSMAIDVVVMDLSMPTGGFVAMREILAVRPSIAIVVLTRHRDEAMVRAAFEHGAAGYVLKQSPFRVLARAIVTATRGEQFIDDRLTFSAIKNGTGDLLPGLSARETEVLRRSAAGYANKEIALDLEISIKTVEAHKANGMRKLGIGDRSSLIRYASMQGWLRED